MQNIDLGKIGEYQFATELLKRGYVPLWPSTATGPYDLGFWNGKRFIRVQVKASTQKSSINLRVSTRVKGKSMKYNSAHADIMAIWAIEADRWYIIPIRKTTYSMRMSPQAIKCKWRIFLDAWDLLG